MWLIRLKFFFTTRIIGGVLLSAVTYVGWFWLCVSLGDHFFRNKFDWRNPKLLVAGSVIALICAVWHRFPRTAFTIRSKASKTQIEVVVGDLLEESGHIVIGCNDFFDTELPQIISPNSIQGKFLQREYNGRHDVLDADIDKSLQDQNISGIDEPGKQFGKHVRYPIGCAAVLGAKQKVYLTAFAHMRDDMTTRTNSEDLWASLCELWRVVRRTANLEVVSMPVLGAGLGRAPGSWAMLAILSVMSFAMMTREEIVTQKLRLLVYAGDYKPEDFAYLYAVLRRLDF